MQANDVKLNESQLVVWRLALGKYHIGASTYRLDDEAVRKLYGTLREYEDRPK